jgi:hypothetical protein
MTRYLFACLALLGAASASAQPGGAKDPAARKRAFVRLREIVRAEPTIREVQEAALKHYQLEPSRIDALSRAARTKGLLPQLDTGIDGTLGHNYQNTQDGLFPTLPFKEKQVTASDQTVWHVHAVWDLSRLAFNPEQLDVKSLNSLQETLVREVTTLYFSRRRLLASLILSPPADDEDAYNEQLRVEELTATIDAFTGGHFAERTYQGPFAE